MAMDAADIAKYKGLYLQTARAYVHDLQSNLRILSSNHENTDAIGVVHLASHSLTSQSLLMGYIKTGSCSFAIEKIFKAKMEGHLSFKESTIKLLSSCVDKISLSLDSIDKLNKEADLTEETKQLETILQL
jgi:chemotaxis protein histidine kinase CheA